MPELPEVETICRGLCRVLPGRVFAGLDIFYAGSLKAPSPEQWHAYLPGRRVTDVGRRGKYILIRLDDGSTVVVHLRMTGRLIFSTGPVYTDKHTHVGFHFRDGGTLTFHDVRKFGTIWWLPDERLSEIKGLASLGPEPLSPDFHFPYLNREIEKRTIHIKSLLLNQEFLAGLGNIYADEILHRANIRPDRPARSLTRAERQLLFSVIREVLEEAINCRGTSMNDYVDSQGQLGAFQERLRVYGRKGEYCNCCRSPIERNTVAGRGTHFCPRCQK